MNPVRNEAQRYCAVLFDPEFRLHFSGRLDL
jgi:hypothetical protein